MKRVRFHSWMRRQLLKLSNLERFSLRRMAALAQSDDYPEFRAGLLLYAHEADCVDRLMRLVYDEAVREEFLKVESRLGSREIERLALRGTPMMLLPVAYRGWFEGFADAYFAPEREEEEKGDLLDRSRTAMLKKGVSPAEIARALNLNKSNAYAYLSSGDTKRFTVETAREIAEYLGASPA